MATNSSNNVIVFLDNIGRTILGKKIAETDSQITVENPVLFQAINDPARQNQLQLQLLPLFYREFLADRTAATQWHFNKASITLSEPVPFAFQFLAHYEQIFQNAPIPAPTAPVDVVKLFDDEEKK